MRWVAALLVLAGCTSPATDAAGNHIGGTVAGPATAAATDPLPVASDLVAALSGFDAFWTAGPAFDGTVLDPEVLARNDELAVWINGNATAAQQFAALQSARYDLLGGAYDLSVTVAPGLGSLLAPLYVRGRRDGSLPLTSAVMNSETGSSGAGPADVAPAKTRYAFPRPYLPGTTSASTGVCSAGTGSAALRQNRLGRAWATADGSLRIEEVPDMVDDSHVYADTDVALTADYRSLCSSPSFPSGHAISAYLAGMTLAALLPELAPEILARASENAADRIVLGVHYPLDVMGGRIAAEVTLADRWSDPAYRRDVLAPARAELVAHLEQRCGDRLAACIARSVPYRNDPFAGHTVPGGTAQVVTDRRSALAVYTERLGYGLPPTVSGAPPSVPAGAENLIRTAFPDLDDAQLRSVLAQTEIAAGFPLDRTAAGDGWQRVDLAAAMSATVRRAADGSVTVTGTGGPAQVLPPT